MSQLAALLKVTRVDLSYFFRTKWLILTLITLNLSDMFVVGLVYTNMMNFDYFVFYVPGVIIAGMFAAALDVGRRVHLGLSEGVSQYYLSLPLSLNGLAFAHILSAGLGGLIFSSILLVVAFSFVHGLLSLSTLAMIPFMFFVSMGLGGIAAVINLFSGGGDRFWAFAEGVQMALLGMSTVFYPLPAVESIMPWYATIAIAYNPLSQIADALRSAAASAPLSSYSLATISLTSLLMLFIGFFCYRHVFSKVRLLGKI
ncbi:MAG: hypothetical protein QXR69_04295 [Conexivisphaerales archaeon]